MIHLVAGLMLAIGAADGAPATRADDHLLETIRVSDKVYVFKPKLDWRNGNGVAIIGPDGVFFIDTYIQFNYAEEAIRRLKKVTKLPIKYVLNTHWHNDHVYANGTFKRRFPECRIISHDSTAVYMDKIVKAQVEDEGNTFDSAIKEITDDIARGKTSRGLVLTPQLKAYWEATRLDVLEYRKHFFQEKYVRPDVTFSDALAMKWGNITLQMIHLGQQGHSEGDVVVWIPETRTLIAGDIVVGPTPYATQSDSRGMVPALNALLAMNPAIIIPGHGDVHYDQSYMQLLVRAFSAYRNAADSLVAAKVPARQAMDSTSFPEIDRQFTHDDEVKQWAYRAFFARLLIYNTYKVAGALPAPPKSP